MEVWDDRIGLREIGTEVVKFWEGGFLLVMVWLGDFWLVNWFFWDIFISKLEVIVFIFI